MGLRLEVGVRSSWAFILILGALFIATPPAWDMGHARAAMRSPASSPSDPKQLSLRKRDVPKGFRLASAQYDHKLQKPVRKHHCLRSYDSEFTTKDSASLILAAVLSCSNRKDASWSYRFAFKGLRGHLPAGFRASKTKAPAFGAESAALMGTGPIGGRKYRLLFVVMRVSRYLSLLAERRPLKQFRQNETWAISRAQARLLTKGR